MPYLESWKIIHDDLNNQAAQFEELEGWFAERVVELGGIPLTRLRMHDMLLWLAIREVADEAINDGKQMGF